MNLIEKFAFWILGLSFIIFFIHNLGGFPPRNPESFSEQFFFWIGMIFLVFPYISKLKFFPISLEKHQPHIGKTNLKTSSSSSPDITITPVTGSLSRDKMKLLNTLWTKQVNRYPEMDFAFSFGYLGESSLAENFHRTGRSLLNDNLVGVTSDNQYYLTLKGLLYCKENYEKFPKELWGEQEKLDERKLEIVFKKITSLIDGQKN